MMTNSKTTKTLRSAPSVLVPFQFLCMMLILVLAAGTNTAHAQDIHTVGDEAVTETTESQEETDALVRSLHGMTMTFIQFAEEHEVDAYETGRWTGRFLTRFAEKDGVEAFTPDEFLAWMEDELAMHKVQFEVLERTSDKIEARRQRVFTHDKLPWFYRYDITLGEYEAFYHGALVEIAKVYGVNYEQSQEGDLVLVTIRE